MDQNGWLFWWKKPEKTIQMDNWVYHGGTPYVMESSISAGALPHVWVLEGTWNIWKPRHQHLDVRPGGRVDNHPFWYLGKLGCYFKSGDILCVGNGVTKLVVWFHVRDVHDFDGSNGSKFGALKDGCLLNIWPIQYLSIYFSTQRTKGPQQQQFLRIHCCMVSFCKATRVESMRRHLVACKSDVIWGWLIDVCSYWKWPFIVDLPIKNCDFP